MQPRPKEITYADMRATAAFMGRFPRRWWIAGGWALDLFVADEASRIHEDVEFGIMRQDQVALREHLADCQLYKSVTGPDGAGQWTPWTHDEWLALPVHQVLAQLLVADRAPSNRLPTEIEFFLSDAEDGEWLFRRDPRIRVPLDRLTTTAPGGLPVLAPEVQLLHKARLHRAKDEHDFNRVLPYLDAERREGLRIQLERCYPGDPWNSRLST
jgi:hypothetical protein